MVYDVTSFWISFAVIFLVVAFFAALIGNYIYKKVKHIPTGTCAECHKNSKKLIKEYHKLYKNKKSSKEGK